MIERGFQNMAIESAKAFRSIMGAMARPGRIEPLQPMIEAPAPMAAATASVALTLCDFQTPLWLAPEFRSDAALRYFRFHTGAPLVDNPAQAAFAFVSAPGAAAVVASLATGTHEYPDRSATLIVQVAALGGRPSVVLSGPGISGTARFHAEGLDDCFWEAMRANAARFPVGIDVIFTSPAGIAACPRSTSIAVMEAA